MAAARNASTTTPKNGRGASRLSFAKISDTLTVPDLLALQTESFDWLVGNDAWKTRVAEAQAGGGEDDPAEQAAAGEGGRPELERALGVLGRGPELLEVAVAVAELVGELRLVEEPRPVRHLVTGLRRLQRPLGPYQRRRTGPYLPQHPVPACLGGVQQRLHGGRRVGAHTLLRDPGELHRLRGQGRQQQQQGEHERDEERPGDDDRGCGPPQAKALQPVRRRVQQIGGGHADQERQQDLSEQVQADQKRQKRNQPDQGEPHALAQEVCSEPIERHAWPA